MKQSHVVILGGGCAGLLAAKVLSDHYAKVSIVEQHHDILKDTTDTTMVRRGIPQGHHLHVLLKRGYNIFNQIFPGITLDLSRHCPKIDWAKDTEWHGPFGKYPEYNSDIETISHSRAFLDAYMVNRIKQRKNINIIIGSGDAVINKTTNSAQSVIIRDNTSKKSQQICADLIIDARGRRSTIASDLDRAGYTIPAQEIIHSNLSYASQIYQTDVPSSALKQVYIQVRKGFRHEGAVISPVENGRIMVTLISLNASEASFDFKLVLKKIIHDETAQILHAAQAISHVYRYRNFANIRRPLGLTSMWPKGLIVIGDARCILNPAYGQGMSIAAEQVFLLQKFFEAQQQHDPHFEYNFHLRADAITHFPWLMAATEDQRGSHEAGLKIRMLQKYLDRVLQASTSNQDLYYSFMRVMHLLDSPYRLLMPKTLFRTLAGKLL